MKVKIENPENFDDGITQVYEEMKIEEAIKKLKEIVADTVVHTEKHYEALQVAINELGKLDLRQDLIANCNKKRREILKLKEEIEFKENRISDLLVERDIGKWRKDFKKKVIELIDEVNKNVEVPYGNDTFVKRFKQKIKEVK